MMTEGLCELGSRTSSNPSLLSRPKLVNLGGDHSVALPALRAMRKIHGQPMALLHFDAHMDTLNPSAYPSLWESDNGNFGSMFWMASQEGLVRNQTNVHTGLRTRLTGDGWGDLGNDNDQGFLRISSSQIDDIGAKGIIDLIHPRIGDIVPVYLSIDIDVLDPAFTPKTGAPESGGWTSRELLAILNGLRYLNIVSADIVEVAPAYDSHGGDTAYVAANLVYEIMTSMVSKGLKQREEQSKSVEVKTEL